MSDLPSQETIYRAEVEDSARWQQFNHRAGDVFICTPPKSGTTWTQGICALLIFGRADVGSGNGTSSPWIELTLDPMDDMNARLAQQTHRRYIKSHSPLDGVIYWPDALYFAVFRHPLDIYFSILKHGDNQLAPGENPVYNMDRSKSFDAFLTHPFQADPTNNTTLPSILHHYRSFLKWQHLPNIHLFHYADMKRDLAGEMARFAEAMDIRHPPDPMADLVRAADFDSMKKNADLFAPEVGDGYWKDKREFFSSGKSNKWEGRLSDAQLAAYDAVVAAALTKDERRWLEWGSA
jgi:aryl sulfotransferase